MKLPSPGFLLDAFSGVCRRFPGAMLCAAVGVTMVFIVIDHPSVKDGDWVLKTWLACQLGLPLLTGLVAFAESGGRGERRAWLLQGAGLALLAGYWFLLDPKAASFDYVGLPRFLVLLLTAHLFAAVAPYLNSRPVTDFWEYNRELFANIVIGAVFTLILFAGLALGIMAVDQLFDLKVDYRIYPKLFILLAGVFNTAYFLYHFPQKYEFSDADAGYNAVFKNLCKYILIPIVGLYFLILYAYSGKIIFTWNLPRGWVSSLVLGFAVAGIFTYLLNFYLPEYDDSAWVRAYRRWFWWIQLPLTALLFVAIACRIRDYGVTELRFLVAHLGIWLAVTCLYFLFSKRDNIKFIPISLGLFALTFAFGPFNAFRVSERNQAKILENLLQKNGRLENGRLKQDTAAVGAEEASRIKSALLFLERRDALRDAPWLPMPLDKFPKIAGVYTRADAIAAWMGIETKEQLAENEYLPVRSTKLPFEGIDVKGFSSFYKIGLNTPGEKRTGYFFNLSDDGLHLDWKQAKSGRVVTVESFDLQPVLRKWLSLKNPGDAEVTVDDNWFDLPGRKGSLRVYFTEAVINQGSPAKKFQSFKSYVFLKEK